MRYMWIRTSRVEAEYMGGYVASLPVLILLGWVDLLLKMDESQLNLYYPI
jgi:hypothetical protein